MSDQVGDTHGDGRDRLSTAAKQALGPGSLVGSFFHSDAERGWQGCVVAEPAPGVYLVETFEWLSGSSHDQQLVRFEDMYGWAFYDHAEWMGNAYDSSVQRRWQREHPPEEAS